MTDNNKEIVEQVHCAQCRQIVIPVLPDLDAEETSDWCPNCESHDPGWIPVLINRGIYYERVNHTNGEKEKAFATFWEEKNDPVEHPFSGWTLLATLLEYHPTQREATAAATVMQWLGTNVGFSYLTKILDGCGYQIISHERIELLRVDALNEYEVRRCQLEIARLKKKLIDLLDLIGTEVSD